MKYKILNKTTEAKNNGLKTNVDGDEITLDKAESLLKDISSGKINGHKFKKEYNSIVVDVEKILNRQPLTINENCMIETLSSLKEILKPNDKKTDEQPDTADMP